MLENYFSGQIMSDVTENFLQDFKPELIINSPGRINFIGEHTDYNSGFVMPTAIDKKIVFSFQKNVSDRNCTIYSQSNGKTLYLDLSNLKPSEEEWENYILGVLYEIGKITDGVKGFDCIITSNLPVGAGISSSAALECGLAYGLNELFSLGLSKMTLVELSQSAEHTYVGTKCGIMDQYASVMSKENKVILLDCKSLKNKFIDASFDPYKILLLNTNVSHNLASSEYNTRREECEAIVKIVSRNYDVDSLRDITKDMLDQHKMDLSNILYKRGTYIIEENQRVLLASEFLHNGNLLGFGELMYKSHRGLQHLYEVSCSELDFLVDFSEKYDQIIGARMMGGGFGGCTINLIHSDAIEDYVIKVRGAYKEQFNIELTSFITVPSHGTSIQSY